MESKSAPALFVNDNEESKTFTKGNFIGEYNPAAQKVHARF